MARRMSPGQIRAALLKAQRDRQRAIDSYNREVRKKNAALMKAVSDYNREVHSYNSRVRAHNREVENRRRRIQQEIQRLNARAARTTTVTYRTSTQTFVEMFERAEAVVPIGPSSPADRRFLDLVGDEVANSVYLANALEGDGDPSDDLSEADLRAPSLHAELEHFGDDIKQRWIGALFALSPSNPDAARHFCTSAREVVITLLDSSASDEEVKRNDNSCQLTKAGAVTRRAKVAYLLRRHGVASTEVADAVDEDVENLLSLFRTFNDGTHGRSGQFTITELTAIRSRVEAAIGFLHHVVTAPA